jgi:DNA-binding PadR family transcriptional regulator
VKGIVRLADHIERTLGVMWVPWLGKHGFSEGMLQRFENEGWIKVDRKVRNTWSVVLTPKGRVVVDQQRRQDR